MSSSVTAIAHAIGAQLDGAGIRNLPYLSDTFTPPVVLVGVDTVGYHEAFGGAGLALHTFTAFLILARSSDRAALEALEGYLSNTGPTSIRALLEADPSLGGTTASCKVVKGGPPAAITIAASVYTSCPFEVQCYAE